MIQCGMYELDITPPLGSTIPGYFNDRKATGIKDHLYAKALVVEHEGKTVAFIGLDCIYVPPAVNTAIRKRIQHVIGIPPEAVMVSATHTHTGGPVLDCTFLKADEDYLAFLGEKGADAAILAYHRRAEAQVGFGRGYEGDIAFNRRFWMKNGKLQTNPGIGNPDIVEPEGPIDPEVLVMRIDDKDGNPLGIVTNYTVHTDTVGGTEYCADFPGELSATLKRELGEGAVSLFFMGASGNINHHNVKGTPVRDPDRYKKMGRILAGEVLKVREKITPEATLDIQYGQRFFPIQHRDPSEEEVAAARFALVNEAETPLEKAFATELLQALECDRDGEVEIHTIQLGPLGVVGVPAELFVEFGLDIKSGSPCAYTMINELSNGSIMGYVCTREGIERGGYEPRITSNSRLPAETGELFVQHALELLRSES